jgi:hypothetical protein
MNRFQKWGVAILPLQKPKTRRWRDGIMLAVE